MALTEPDFIERDADKITVEMIAKYEADTGKTLYPAQAEHLLIDLWVYREMLIRVAVQEAAKQNLVAFAREPMIDYLGELVGLYRLAAQPTSTPVRCRRTNGNGCADTGRHPRQRLRQRYFRHRCGRGTEGVSATGQCHGDLYRTR